MMITRTYHSWGRKWSRSKIFARGLDALLETALRYVEEAREARREEYTEYVVRKPVPELPGWMPMRRVKRIPDRTRGNPWREARRHREYERLLLLGEEG